MILGKRVGIELMPAEGSSDECAPRLPGSVDRSHPTHFASELLTRWLAARFDPLACRRELEAVIARWRLPEGWFDPAAIVAGERPLAAKFIFPETVREDWLCCLTLPGEATHRALLEPSEALVVADLLRAGGGTNVAAFREACRDLFAPDVVKRLCRGRVPRSEWPAVNAPGIYRREHASVVVRSRTTSILIDPLCRERGLPFLVEGPSSPSSDRFDAIMITHGHGDHWDPASILCEARTPETLVVVPPVPRLNLLNSADYERSLQALGQSVVAPPWWTTLQIGDIEVDILPFFGEQPTRHPSGLEPGLRNWGSCYRFNTPEFSALVLADTGADPDGSMVEVVAASFARRGPVDVVLSSLLQIKSPFRSGLASEILTLRFDRIRELFREHEADRLPLTTSGPDGVADICAAAHAKHFLPYAHGFRALGTPLASVCWGHYGPSESESVDLVAAGLRRSKACTDTLEWNPGDRALVARGGFEIHRATGRRDTFVASGG